VNNEARGRRSTKPVELGKAKIMSYEDLEEVRVKRAIKNKPRQAKGKCGRKRKIFAIEADKPERMI
jgi:hypothetical protein